MGAEPTGISSRVFRDGLLDGQVCVVSGAGSGLGRETALELARLGAVVIGCGRRAEPLAETAALAEGLAGSFEHEELDIREEDAVAAFFDGALERHGRIDVLVNNAGLGGTSSLLEMTDEQWLAVLDVTLTGTFRCTRAVLRQMVAQGHGGAVVNNASVLGWRAQPGQAHYAAAKAGVMALTRCAALDVAQHGIRVNAVAPSLAIHPFLAKVTSEELLAELAGREAFGRAAHPGEVANVIVFLASDYASYLTGEVVSVSSQHP